MRKFASCFVLVCMILFVTVMPVMADLLFDHPSIGASAPDATSIYNFPYGGGTMGYKSWDDFNLGSNSTVNSISFRGWTLPGVTMSSVDWALFADVSGAPDPGSALYSGTVSPSITSAGYQINWPPSLIYDVNDYLFPVGSLSLSTGVYWLRLDNATGAGTDAYWESTEPMNGTGNGFVQAFNNDVLTYTNSGFDLVFSVNGTASAVPVPEPATMLLLGSGLVGLGGLRKRFKKS